MDNTGEFTHRSIIHLLFVGCKATAPLKLLPSRHSQCESLYTQKSDPQHQHNTPGSTTGLELRSAEREQTKMN